MFTKFLNLQESSATTHSDSLGSSLCSPTTVNKDIQNGESSSSTLVSLPLKILQPKVTDPLKDPNTVSFESFSIIYFIINYRFAYIYCIYLEYFLIFNIIYKYIYLISKVQVKNFQINL